MRVLNCHESRIARSLVVP